MTHMTDTFCFLTRIPKLYNRVPGKAWNASRQSYESHRPYRKRRRKYTLGLILGYIYACACDTVYDFHNSGGKHSRLFRGHGYTAWEFVSENKKCLSYVSCFRRLTG